MDTADGMEFLGRVREYTLNWENATSAQQLFSTAPAAETPAAGSPVITMRGVPLVTVHAGVCRKHHESSVEENNATRGTEAWGDR